MDQGNVETQTHITYLNTHVSVNYKTQPGETRLLSTDWL